MFNVVNTLNMWSTQNVHFQQHNTVACYTKCQETEITYSDFFLLTDILLYYKSYKRHRRSQDFVWGCTFFGKKVDYLFLVVALTDRLNTPYTSKSKPLSKNCPKNLLLLWLGVHFVSWEGTLTHFSCKLGQKKISPPWGVQLHPLHPLATPMTRENDNNELKMAVLRKISLCAKCK